MRAFVVLFNEWFLDEDILLLGKGMRLDDEGIIILIHLIARAVILVVLANIAAEEAPGAAAALEGPRL